MFIFYLFIIIIIFISIIFIIIIIFISIIFIIIIIIIIIINALNQMKSAQIAIEDLCSSVPAVSK